MQVYSPEGRLDRANPIRANFSYPTGRGQAPPLHFFVFAFDGVVAGATLIGWCFLLRATKAWATGATGTSASLAIDRLADLVERLLQSLARGLDARHVVGCEGCANIGYLGLQLASLLGSELIAEIGHALFGAVGCAIGQVALLNLFLATLVLGCVRLRIVHHTIDLVLRKATGRHNGNLLFPPCALIAS